MSGYIGFRKVPTLADGGGIWRLGEQAEDMYLFHEAHYIKNNSAAKQIDWAQYPVSNKPEGVPKPKKKGPILFRNDEKGRRLE